MSGETLLIHEIYASIQGESTFAGLPCTFIRTTGCDLRCRWCDTPEAFDGGTTMSRAEVLAAALEHNTELVELTGGEPLLQLGALPLLTELCDAGRTVLLETSGAADIANVDQRVHIIMDLKPPGSGEHRRNRLHNLSRLGPRDEIKFVLTDRADFDWMCQMIADHDLGRSGVALLASPVLGQLDARQLVSWLLEDRAPVRLNLQLHKLVWGPRVRGV